MPCGDDLRDLISQIVCRKAPGTSFVECFARNRMGESPCHNRHQCRIAEKTEEQLSYAAHDIARNSFLRACPGSGKTEVVGLMAAYHIARWMAVPGGLAVLTFTRNAANEITERVAQYMRTSTVPYPHFVGTIDSWLYEYVVQPFGWLVTKYSGDGRDLSVTLVDADCEARFLNGFTTRYSFAKRGRVRANEYFYNHEHRRYEFRSNDDEKDRQRNTATTESWAQDDLRRTKERFWTKGYATHEDMENIAYELVTGNDRLRYLLRRRFPCIVIDECQDLSWIQLRILESLLREGVNVHLVGDLNQSIYSFRGANPERVHAFVEDNGFIGFALSRNFRSVQPIVDLCSRLILPDCGIEGNRHGGKMPACVYTSFEGREIHELVARFEAYLMRRGYDARRCAVLTRARSMVVRLRPGHEDVSWNKTECLARAIYLWQFGGRQAVDEALRLAGRFVAGACFEGATNGEKYHYCPVEEKSHMRWRLFLSRFLRRLCNTRGIADLEQPWSVWAAGVRNELASALAEVAQGTIPLDLNCNSVVSPRGRAGRKVIDDLNLFSSSVPITLRVTTIHDAKGEAFDAVLLVSALTRNSKGGHWSQWIGQAGSRDVGEYVRFAYVACSRPRELLVWAVPRPSTEDARVLESLGLARVAI